MAIPPIGAVGAVSAPLPPVPVAPAASVAATGATGAAAAASGATAGATSLAGVAQATQSAGFAQALAGVVDNLQGVQASTNKLAMQAATGELRNPHDYLLAASESSMMTQMTVAVRNKALESFNEIMRMPL
jgi:flagellar hook-basal body complex protein FliE